jgi:CO/xanthine dehydrogenase Mo-binding subunit
MGKLDLSRRGFLKASAMAGLTVVIAPIGSRAFAALFEEKILTPIKWDALNGQAQCRIDGMAKVTGAKVFARDLRASDLPHWPAHQSHAFILRTTQADRLYQGFDLTLLGDELKPDRIVTAEDLARDGLAFPAFYGDDMLLPPGKTPAYLGHAVAMLIYHDFARFQFAKDKLQFRDDIIRYGDKTGPLERDPWGTFRFVRVGGASSRVPFYGIVAAMYGNGNPVRLAFNRYEQFQTSLKRHSSKMHYRMAIDKQSGLLQSFKCDFEIDGGGRCNFSPSVAMVGATAAQSDYYFPKSDMTGVAIASRAIDAGSARGYGTLQTMAATEMLIDEFADQLGLDAIDLRLKNALRSGMKNTQGAIPGGAIRVEEILRKAKVHPLWTARAAKKTDYEASHPGSRYGVGFACVQKDFGTGAESSFAKVEISFDGKIVLHHTAAEMGTGVSTSQAIACAKWLGKPAAEVRMAVIDWAELPVVTSGDPYLMSQAEQDSLSANPRWSPNYVSPSSATNSAFYFTHSTQEAARVVFMHGLWPAAMSIWSEGIGGGQAARSWCAAKMRAG